MGIDRSEIMDNLEEIQEKVHKMGFKGSNERELWMREEIADYIVKKLSLSVVSQRSELLAFEQWVDKNTTTALNNGIKLAIENYKKANSG